ncbi:MAG: DUF2029 domain-containing protein [Chloroflexi bacterium]|nr:DUF2029 domain-containing protein [Chloroflexota bacterium]
MVADGRGRELFDPAALTAIEQSTGAHFETTWAYLNPPFFAGLLAPLSALPFDTAFVVWTALQLALFAGSLTLLWRLTGALEQRTRLALLGASVLFVPAAHALHFGQFSMILLASWTAATLVLRARRDALLGLELAPLLVKPELLIPVTLALLLSGRRRAIGVLDVCTLAGGRGLGGGRRRREPVALPRVHRRERRDARSRDERGGDVQVERAHGRGHRRADAGACHAARAAVRGGRRRDRGARLAAAGPGRGRAGAALGATHGRARARRPEPVPAGPRAAAARGLVADRECARPRTAARPALRMRAVDCVRGGPALERAARERRCAAARGCARVAGARAEPRVHLAPQRAARRPARPEGRAAMTETWAG